MKMNHFLLMMTVSLLAGISATRGTPTKWCGTTYGVPDYKDMTKPKRILTVPGPHGICVNHAF